MRFSASFAIIRHPPYFFYVPQPREKKKPFIPTFGGIVYTIMDLI